MEKETPVETASVPDAVSTKANAEPRSEAMTAPDTGKVTSNPAPRAAGDEDDSDWEELDGMYHGPAAVLLSQYRYHSI